MPLGKVRGFGGKLGAELEALGCTTAGQAQGLSPSTLQQHFGDRARWVAMAVRGLDDEPVREKARLASVNSCKSFDATSEPAVLQRWLLVRPCIAPSPSAKRWPLCAALHTPLAARRLSTPTPPSAPPPPRNILQVLAEELAERLSDEEATHRRRARTLVLHYRSRTAKGERSLRCPMPPTGRDGASSAALAAGGAALLARAGADALPCVRLALCATDFSEQGSAAANIGRFFKARGADAPAGGAAAAAAAADEGGDDGGDGGRADSGRTASAAPAEARAAGPRPAAAAPRGGGGGGAARATAPAPPPPPRPGTLDALFCRRPPPPPPPAGPPQAEPLFGPALFSPAPSAPPSVPSAPPLASPAPVDTAQSAEAAADDQPIAAAAPAAGEGDAAPAADEEAGAATLRLSSAGGDGGEAAPGSSGGEVIDLTEIDAEEQAGLMRGFEMAAARRGGGPAATAGRGGGGRGGRGLGGRSTGGSKRPAAASPGGASGKNKQMRISALFGRPPPPRS